MSTGAFSENHDQPRLQSITTDQSLVKNAMAWSFVSDGVPITYYGQEQGFTGSQDPSNREAYVSVNLVNGCGETDVGECRLWSSGYLTQNKPLVMHVTTLNQARKAAINASSSFLTTPVRMPTSANFLIRRPLPAPHHHFISIPTPNLNPNLTFD